MTMKLAIMQPYFLPYIGYFQLIKAVDEFVVYDNIEYTKKGWVNRNRILVNGRDEYITLSLKKDSDYLPVNERYLSDSWPSDRTRLLNKVLESYRKAANFNEVYELFKKIILYENNNLFNYIFNSIEQVKDYLGIHTQLVISSTIPINHQLKSTEKVIALCKAREADIYINPIGGIELYDKEYFKSHQIDLGFLKSNPINYKQFHGEFVPWLSILDVMMFNSRERIYEMLNQCEFV